MIDVTSVNKVVRKYLGDPINDYVELTCPEYNDEVEQWYAYVEYQKQIVGVVYVSLSGKVNTDYSTHLSEIISQLPI